MSTRKQIMVDTPNGLRFHGYVVTNQKGQKVFVRNLTNKDYMRIFDAWSIHPQALDLIKEEGVIGIQFNTPNKTLKLKISDLDAMLNGDKLDKKDRKLAWFRDSFAGGDTIYIKEEAFQNG